MLIVSIFLRLLTSYQVWVLSTLVLYLRYAAAAEDEFFVAESMASMLGIANNVTKPVNVPNTIAFKFNMKNNWALEL